MEISGNIYIKVIQLLSRLKWIKTPKLNAEILGDGHFRYQVDRYWCQANRKALPVNNCHEMVVDRQQRLYLLTDHPHNNIIILNPDGTVVDSWTLHSSGAHGLTIAANDECEYLLICDPYHPRVLKTSLNGEVLESLPNPFDIGVYTASMPYAPTQTVVSANGDIYIADGYGSQSVLQFDAQGNFIRLFGGKGKDPSNLDFAHGIAIDSREADSPVLLVTSRKQSCIKQFTLDGQYLDQIELPGGYPCRPVIHGENLFVSLCWSGTHLKPNSGFVIVLDRNNQLCGTIGGLADIDDEGNLIQLSTDYSTFCHVHDVCIDAKGNLYVCQWNAGKSYPYKLALI